MADVLVGSERRVLISGYGYGLPPQPPPPPPAESQLLGRLDQIDLRLRQLEEQQQRRPSHAEHGAAAPAPARRAPAAQHQHTKSLPAALQHVQVRSDLMDRLNLLESRIRQLSSELDLDVGGKAAGHAAHQLVLGTSSSVPSVEDPATWSDLAPVAVVDPAPAAFGGGNAQGKGKSKSKPAAAAGGSWSAVEILQRGARQLHRSTSSKPNPPNKVKKLKETKCACQKEKRKAERSKTSRWWFMVGC